ncbi:uncharacterized protein Z519_02907 [Cladophialophora bantiana CBS 173.52]|uniref:Uncharacterized protein n=1 Tax=Cladophialophora bantiana (strain ATCC 10958 / CBS 173.52 / CDC B-1940 / NIH 8579) TaxID=1442370 RepID=A0A0D2HQW1_CLAB1|nr:uncharacterized protein Z519_02907 [Cladophialophora bantiana CBS 173.52]KIW95843.1 hypothetical protein Z519_02907 [Cladophialophora bantiana CBS 173.52]
MSPPSFNKNENEAQRLGAAVDRMRIASVLNDDDQDHDDRMECETSQSDDVQSRDEGSDTGDSTEDSNSEATSRSSIDRRSIDRRSIDRMLRERRRRRPHSPCKKYTPEQAYFIWYYRTDLEQAWDEVERAFQRQFGEDRKKPGLQCKFYRLLGEEGVAKVREQAKSGHRTQGDKVGKFGVVQRTTARFPWMRLEDQLTPPLPCFATRGGCGNSTCETCSGTNHP